MSTKTTTKVAHYYVQKQRRAEFIENGGGPWSVARNMATPKG